VSERRAPAYSNLRKCPAFEELGNFLSEVSLHWHHIDRWRLAADLVCLVLAGKKTAIGFRSDNNVAKAYEGLSVFAGVRSVPKEGKRLAGANSLNPTFCTAMPLPSDGRRWLGPAGHGGDGKSQATLSSAR
jgi:hypothetical protein